MALHDVLVALTVLVLVLAVLGWRRGRRLQALFDSVRGLSGGAFTSYRHGSIEQVPLADRALRQKDGGVTVTVAVLSAKEKPEWHQLRRNPWLHKRRMGLSRSGGFGARYAQGALC